MKQVPGPRPHPGEQRPPAEERRDYRFDEPDEESEWKRPHQGQQTIRLGHCTDGSRLLAPIAYRRFVWELDFGGRCDHNPGRPQPRPLREVDGRRLRSEQLIKATKSFGKVATHEKRRTVDGGDIAHHVILPRIDLAIVEAEVRNIEHVGGDANRDEPLGHVSIEDL